MASHRWKRFFIEAGLPSDIADNYAIIFTENRIRFDMLDELNKEILYDMKIKKMGDVISILRHAKEVHSNTYKEKVFKSDENTEKDSVSKTIHQADSTISSNNSGSGNNEKNQRMASTRIVRHSNLQDSSVRIVRIPNEPNSNNSVNNQPRTPVISKTNVFKNTPPVIIRNVTGLNTTIPIRKRIEPPTNDDTPITTATSLKFIKTEHNSLSNVAKNIETQNRLTNFSNQIQKTLASNIRNVPILRYQQTQQPLPIQSRLVTKKNDTLFTKTIRQNATKPRHVASIKDRIGKKSVFERIQIITPKSSSRSIFNRLGTK